MPLPSPDLPRTLTRSHSTTDPQRLHGRGWRASLRLAHDAPAPGGRPMTEPVRASEHQTPEGVSEETIEGVGKLSEAFEYIERAKGHLYSFHQLMGRADFLVEEAADILRKAGH